MKTCRKCKETKPLTEYYKDKGMKDGHLNTCKKCRLEQMKEYNSENKEKISEYKKDYYSKPENLERVKRLLLQKKYGITLDDYNEMSHGQKGSCAICGKHALETGTLCVDHCHKTGEVRGLLCNNCNKGIGLLRDDPDTLRQAAEYLERYK